MGTSHEHLSELPKSETLPTQNASERACLREFSLIAGVIQGGAANLQDSLAVNGCHAHCTTQPCTAWYLLKGTENLCPHENQHRAV